MNKKQLGASIGGHLGLLDMYSLMRRALTHSQVAIIMYHQVSSEEIPWLPGAVKLDDFEREIAYLHKVAEIVPLHQLVDWIYQGKGISSKAVIITFDDGYKDNYTFAYPILRKYNAPATIFLTTGYIGRSEKFSRYKLCFAIWNTSRTQLEVNGLGHYNLETPQKRLTVMRKIIIGLDKLPKRQKNLLIEKLLQVLRVDTPNKFEEKLMLSWDEVLDMSKNGISFGAHTVMHPILTELPIEEAREEIVRSKKDIEKRLGAPCTLFAYPNGEFNTEIVELLKENGFKGAVTTVPRMIAKRANPFMLNRINAGSNFYTFKAYLSGFYPDLMAVLKWVRGRAHQR